jgi:hypothetical protein
LDLILKQQAATLRVIHGHLSDLVKRQGSVEDAINEIVEDLEVGEVQDMM